MGTYYSGVVVVGRPVEDFEDTNRLEDLLDDYKSRIQQIIPYHDADNTEGVVGYVITRSEDYAASEFEWSEQEVNELKARFKEVTGLSAKLYISPWCT